MAGAWPCNNRKLITINMAMCDGGGSVVRPTHLILAPRFATMLCWPCCWHLTRNLSLTGPRPLRPFQTYANITGA